MSDPPKLSKSGLSARGVYGEVRKGYQVVARLGSWEIERHGRVDATPLEVNHFRLEQGGELSLWLKLGRRFWVWRSVEIVDASTPFVVRFEGSPEVRD